MSEAPSPSPEQQPSGAAEQPSLALFSRADLPSVWVDHAKFSVRRNTKTNTEILAILAFFTAPADEELKTKGFEAVRVCFSPELARRVVDAMCQNLDYYPTKPTTIEGSS